MKISLKWLNDFVDITEYLSDPQKLADILTKAGLEVEEIQNRSKDYFNVVVGQIISKDKHPNADKLSLCQVEVSQAKILQIVCGAQNHKAGDKVIVALVGAVLPGNFVIKKSKIRDVESNGMLCSYKELGIAETTEASDGIAILASQAQVGLSFAEFAGYDDVVFELKVTPNRADCLSHYGLARELSCLLNKPIKTPEVLNKVSVNRNHSDGSAYSIRDRIKLTVLNSELCPRYCGRYIIGVKIGPSPDWLKNRLAALGQNSINNIVDVTNYVMLEMGQPLHAFDADLITGASIIVRTANKQEKFVSLKEQEIVLTGEELVICDEQKPVALAGVIGALNSGVSTHTKNIFLESASFNAMSIRKSSRLHGIETDSAYRFSRGVDASATAHVMDRAALLIVQVAGGEVYSEAYDTNPALDSVLHIKKPIRISLKTVSDRLGYEVNKKLFLDYMKGLQIKVETLVEVLDSGDAEYLMTPPHFRFDLEHEMDLVEEYARLHGYENIQESIPALRAEPSSHDGDYILNQKIAQFIRGEGFDQAFNYAFTNEVTESNWVVDILKLKTQGLNTDENAIKIKNPISEELNVMRRTVSLGLWQNALDNIRSGNQTGALFEVGSVFSKVASNEMPLVDKISSKPSGQYMECSRLALIEWGEPIGIYANEVPPIYNIKAAIENLFQLLQISSYSFVTDSVDKNRVPSFLHLGQWAQVIMEGRSIGFIGSIHPKHLDNEKVRVPVAIAELDLQQVLKGQPRPNKVKPFSKFQPVIRDFSFVMGAQKNIGDLLKEAKKTCATNLKDLTVFDIYEGDELPAGQKSVSLRATFLSTDAVLTELDLQQLSQRLVEAAAKSVDAKLR